MDQENQSSGSLPSVEKMCACDEEQNFKFTKQMNFELEGDLEQPTTHFPYLEGPRQKNKKAVGLPEHYEELIATLGSRAIITKQMSFELESTSLSG